MSNPLEQLLKSLTPDKKALLAEYLRPKPEPVAVIGIGCRFPGGLVTPDAFWEFLKQGQDSIIEVPSDRWDIDAYYDPNPDAPGKMYTRWGSFLTDAPMFDASFFGLSPREALRMDPQHRLLLEVAWQALEDAGQQIDSLAGSQTGVFIGLINNDYPVRQLYADGAECFNDPYFSTGSSSSMAAGRLAYLLDLQGPTMTLDTACSSTLVATHLAVQSLQSKESNLALVGGSNVVILPDSFVSLCKMRMFSSDGRCKTFDAAADGFVIGEGCGFVVLKRLSDAIKDGDQVRAIIRGSAVNEDGRSSSITAPNGLAQQAVIRKALAVAGLKPQQISYVEAHGSGTSLGDPIEMESLRAVLGKGRSPDQPLYVGAVKTNIGHLAAGSGVAGLIKTVLSLQHKQIPPHLNFKTLNPGIPKGGAPFVVPTSLTPWTVADGPRLAGVSSFGWSGTNAHVILEEAPPSEPLSAARPTHVLLLSARTPTALEKATENLLGYLHRNPDCDLADVAHTLQRRRKHFAHRRAVICRDVAEAIAGLSGQNGRIHTGHVGQERPVAFVFAGVGDHYAGMAKGLYANEVVFRTAVDHALALLPPLDAAELRAALYPSNLPAAPAAGHGLLGRNGVADGPLHQTALAQPAVFVVEYALAQLMMTWGVRPQALLGYSLGEYVAATISGVLSLEDALALVARRAQLIQALPKGAMLAVAAGADAIQSYLGGEVCLAAVNSPSTCVLAGPHAALNALSERLSQAEIACRPVETSHAFHSTMLAPAQEALTAFATTLTFNSPSLPYLSNVTGTWITVEQATDPAYWARHMVETVQFAPALGSLLADPAMMLVEIGPGQALGSFARQHPACDRQRFADIVATLPAKHEAQSELAAALSALGRLWVAGARVDWAAFAGAERRRSVALPPYPFERERFWIDLDSVPTTLAPARPARGKQADIADWFYRPVWEPHALALLAPAPTSGKHWLVFVDERGLGRELGVRLEQAGDSVVRVRRGDGFARIDHQTFDVRPDAPEDYLRLLQSLSSEAQSRLMVAHLWSLDATPSATGDQFAATQRVSFYSLLALAQALGPASLASAPEIAVVCAAVHSVIGTETINPDLAAILGPARVIPQELQGIGCRTIDLGLPQRGSTEERELLDLLARELLTQSAEPLVAYRNNQRWVAAYKPVRLDAPARTALREHGTYLITGGLGDIGLMLAEHLAATVQARLVLLARSELPDRSEWPRWLSDRSEDDRTCQRIRAVQRLEELGAEVLTITADVADESALRAAIDRATERFGAIHGVIHAAGIVATAAFRSVQDSDPAICEQHFQPKVHGLYALERVLGDRSLDFCVLFSSLSSVLGGLGFSAYVAANSFMDAFAHRHNQSHPVRWLSVNWDLWLGSVDKTMSGGLGASLTEYGMTPAEGIAAFERVLSVRDASQIVNSTGDLDTRIAQWVRMEALAVGANAPTPAAKMAHARPELNTAYVPPRGEYEQRIAAIWQEALGLDQVGIQDNFFDLGGNSLVGIQVIARLQKEFKVQLSTVVLFEAPTISALATYLMERLPQVAGASSQPQPARRQQRQAAQGDIAIIGMAGRFPGAGSVDELWSNISQSHEAFSIFSDEELLAAGVAPALVRDPNYVKRRPILGDDIGLFDAAFFGYSPREAEFMDPQQRLFHECAWEALETAGYDSQRYDGLVGVFAGASVSTYMLQLAALPVFNDFGSDPSAYFSNDKDGLTTNVSYKLNLHGPSVAVQTYCSTSLVATHMACRSLRGGECDIALAGGVSVRVPVKTGYLYRDGDQVSPDGRCRTFDAEAGGANFGDGVAIVVLKRLADALADGDTIHAVIRGSAINNDGGLKVGYTAPSVVGQAKAIAAALDDAGVTADSISYVEAHGTATKLGDPIEIASLTKAFRASTDKVGFCGISSVKPNIGHLDRAAGVTGLIKTVLALKHSLIPPTLHFHAPNPEIDFAASPFYVLTEPTPWTRNGTPRRAVVNSLGVGGTNAHVVVEEAPPAPAANPSRPTQLLLLSAKTPTALEAATARLSDHLGGQDVNLADVAYTLQVGRRVFEHRRVMVCEDATDARSLLTKGDTQRALSRQQKPTSRNLAFVFAGVGDHYAGMAQGLYETESVFRATVDECFRILSPLLGADLKQALYPEGQARRNGNGSGVDLRALLGRDRAVGGAAGPLHQTALAQPAVFVVEYALAQLLMTWGIRPHALLGYSLGEYVAAAVAGVLSLEDALALVARRAQLIQSLPSGAMLAVAAGADAVRPYLGGEVCLAVVNSPSTCVLAGPQPALAAVADQLEALDISSRWLETSHAFHSTMLASVQAELTAFAATLTFHLPAIPYLSNVTGTWITAEQATDPAYWAAHMCQTVQFAASVAVLAQDANRVMVEIGPGQALGSFVKQSPAWGRDRLDLVLSTLPSQHEGLSDSTALLTALGRLWLIDVPIDWQAFAVGEQRRRVPLPTYPFERQRYWLEPSRKVGGLAEQSDKLDLMGLPRDPANEWFYLPAWKQSAPYLPALAASSDDSPRCWVIFEDACAVGQQIGAWLRQQGQHVVSVHAGAAFAKNGDSYTINAGQRSDYDELFNDLYRQNRRPTNIVHLWTVTPPLPHPLPDPLLGPVLDASFYSLIHLGQALGDLDLEACTITVVSSDMQSVIGSERQCPEKATLIGPCKLLQFEYAALGCRSVDIVLPERGSWEEEALISHLLGELTAATADTQVALRGNRRWVQSLDRLKLAAQESSAPRLRKHGVYLITGGLGGIGLALAEHLARTQQARLALVGRSGLPERSEWPALLARQPEHAHAGKIRQIQAIEALGGEVLVLRADVTDTGEIEAAVAQTIEHFGSLHGVLHAAGVPGVGLISLKTREAAASVLAPKVQGTRALAQALDNIQLDFLALFSSVASATGGGAGQVDYCAANAYLDAFAHSRAGQPSLVVSIGWCEWLWNAWDEAMSSYDSATQEFFRDYRERFGLRFDEGSQALDRVLSHRFPNVFVSTQDLRAIVRMMENAKIDVLEQPEAQGARHARPSLGTSYVKPQSKLEQAIAAVWSERLGIAEIGLNDNFFELGGNSLIGVDLLNRLRKRLQISQIPAYVLYEAPTVGAMAKFLEPGQDTNAAIQERHDRGAKRRDRQAQLKLRS
ncbi:MAG: SDR family oxidoreductase [Chloroflexi bacterium]|nr:SDR family oxidoreductase [Chloroflexota bacterium]